MKIAKLLVTSGVRDNGAGNRDWGGYDRDSVLLQCLDCAVDIIHPERDVPQMIQEWVRLGFRKLVLLINLNQFWFPGHITMRPLWWWADQWKTHFQHVSTTSQFPNLPAVYSNTGAYNQQWTFWTSNEPASR